MKNKNQLVEIWGDVVELRSLILSILLTSITTMGAYFFAPMDKTKQLFFGLFGAVLGFLISAIVIKPKRIIILEEDNKEK